MGSGQVVKMGVRRCCWRGPVIAPSRPLSELAMRAIQLSIALSSIMNLENTVRVYHQLLMKIYGFHK